MVETHISQLNSMLAKLNLPDVQVQPVDTFLSSPALQSRVFSITVCGVTSEWELIFSEHGVDICPIKLQFDKARQEKLFTCLHPSMEEWNYDSVDSLERLVAATRKGLESLIWDMFKQSFSSIPWRVDCDCTLEPQFSECGTFLTSAKITTQVPFQLPNQDIQDFLMTAVFEPGNSTSNVSFAFSNDGTLSATSHIKAPRWDSKDSLSEYKERIIQHIQDSHYHRRQLIDKLLSTYSNLEYDAHDFSSIRLLAKIKGNGKTSMTRIFWFRLSFEFPQVPPDITIFDIRSTGQWSLNPSRYRYSPRWDAGRMATELFNHACQEAMNGANQVNV